MARSRTSYKPKWKSGETTVIRVPKRLASQIVEVAEELDNHLAEDTVLQEPGAEYHTSVVINVTKPDRQQPINVASVPQRSPFRYPGGKTWLVPYARQWLRAQKAKPSLLIEPFAGGGIVGLTAGIEDLVDHVLLVEKDPYVAAVWKTILGGDAEWLSRRILSFELTPDAVKEVLDKTASTASQGNKSKKALREQAFATILRNRVQRGGIMAPGAGLVKHGEDGRGLRSRWYPQTLARRINEIHQRRDRFTFVESDGIDVIRQYADRKDALFFVDPPYTVAAKRLYHHWEVDHRNLFELLAGSNGDVLLTYDHTEEIRELASLVGFDVQEVAMKNTHHANMTELLIGPDLQWLNASGAPAESGAQTVQGTLGFHQ